MTYSLSCEIHFVVQNQEKKVYFCQQNVTPGGNTLSEGPKGVKQGLEPWVHILSIKSVGILPNFLVLLLNVQGLLVMLFFFRHMNF